MKKGLYILGLVAVLMVLGACEKCEKPVMTEDPFATVQNRGAVESKEDSGYATRNGEESDESIGDTNDGGITDPNEDEDFDGIVDPDEDEDFDKDGNENGGK